MPGPARTTIAASSDAQFDDEAEVRPDPGDSLRVEGHHVLHDAFTTYRGILGLDFRVTACESGHSQETWCAPCPRTA